MAFRIPLIKPYIPEESKTLLMKTIDSGFLTEGQVTRDFEAACRDFIGCKHALAVSSCTTGLELALRCLGIGPGDEVAVPDYTYPATADAVAICGAKALLVDVSPETLLIDYDKLEKAMNPRVKAIMPVSQFGNPLDHERLALTKKKWGVKIIEDAACAFGSGFKGIKTGNIADISVFSFHPRKFITSGEGGLVTTNDAEMASWMDSYKHFGLRSGPTGREAASFAMLGTNYKMSNLLSALALPQLRMVDRLMEKRQHLVNRYSSRLLGKPGILGLQKTGAGGKHSYQTFGVFVENALKTINALRSQGIEAQIGTYCLHAQTAFGDASVFPRAGEMSGSKWAYAHFLALPLYHEMTETEQDEVITALLANSGN
ncbi:MAG: aminotransferase DegT [Lentisphaerae bacterium GWF2_52_8]|nr:MAG: aminotransferase DegT [Lentisphaerae bacterium GWF2_52_8]